MTIPLIKHGWFQSHSGLQLPFKIDCDALSDETIEEIAKLVATKFRFGWVKGVPTGGLRLERALIPFTMAGYPLLIVDDVLTTGSSMVSALEDAHEATAGVGRTIGFVIVARGPCPNWVWPLFTVNDWASARGTGPG